MLTIRSHIEKQMAIRLKHAGDLLSDQALIGQILFDGPAVVVRAVRFAKVVWRRGHNDGDAACWHRAKMFKTIPMYHRLRGLDHFVGLFP
jgi:hypothetical protein